MMEFILYTFLAIFLVAVLALVLPIRVMVRASGGTDGGFRATGRVLLFGGILGGGGEYGAGVFRAGMYLGARRVIGVDVSRLVQGKRTSKPREAAAPRSAETVTGRPLGERFRDMFRGAKKYRPYAGIVLRESKSLVRVDRFEAGFTLGFGDPALTGEVAGVLYALNGFLPERYAIIPGWDFTRRVFSGSAGVELTFRTYLFWVHLVRGLLAYARCRRGESLPLGEAALTREA